MGEIADMMLDGTMDCETGEWNFDGEDGPGWPMTGAEAAAYRRAMGHRPKRRDPDAPREAPLYSLTKAWRAKIEKFGTVQHNDAYHWQVRHHETRKVIADWWPHRMKFRMAGKAGTLRGDERALCAALAKEVHREEGE